jgi:acyl-CoA synthetase (NDP forming)
MLHLHRPKPGVQTFLKAGKKHSAMPKQLDQENAQKLLAKYKIPVCLTRIFALGQLEMPNRTDAKILQSLKYPIVLKTAAEEVLHKSDIGAVIANIQNHAGLVQAAKAISQNVKKHYPNAKEIFVLQEQLKGRETIIGIKQDPQFGPVLMFGLGGIFVEVFKDVSFRIAPIKKEDALAMINEIKGAALLKGARGEKPADLGQIADILLKASKLAEENKQIIELDFNPVIVNEKGAKVVDVRIIMQD